MRTVARALAFSLAIACPAAGADERVSEIEADIEADGEADIEESIETVLALRRELHDAIRLVAERHAALELAAASVRDGTHPFAVAIARLREDLATALAERRASRAQALERLRAAQEERAVWLAAAGDALAALESERSALREAYLVAKGEHDELAAELAETVAEFNDAARAYNADPTASAAEAERLREMESRIAEGRSELERRREQALERYSALANVERAWREEQARVRAERGERGAALARMREELSAVRARDEESLARRAGEVRERAAELEAMMREELALLRSAREDALSALERDFGSGASALAEGIDRWLESGSRAGLFTPADAARFDRTLARIEALYAAVERVEAPSRAPAVRVVEEE